MNVLRPAAVAAIASLLFWALPRARAQSVITEWNFDNLTAGSTNLTPSPSTGAGSASSVGMTDTGTLNYPTANATGPDTSNINNVQGTDADNASAGNNVWRLVGSNGWNSNAAIGTQGAQFNVSTAGESNVYASFDIMITVQGEADLQVEYTTDGATWQNAPLAYGGPGGSVLTNTTNPSIVMGNYFHGTPTTDDTWFNGISVNLSGISAVNDNPNFGIRIVNAATGSADVNLKTNGALNNTSGNWRLDDVVIGGSTLIATPPPSIATQPVSQTVNPGSGVVLAVAASGASAYQWYLNGNPISGATNSTLYLAGVTAANAGTYVVDVSGAGGVTPSTGAILTVGPAVTSSVIATQPMSQTINPGSSVVFTVQASSPNATFTSYQWQYNGVNLTDGSGISGSTGPQLVIQGATAGSDGDYACLVITSGISAQSNSGGLVVSGASNPGLATSISTRAFVGTGDNILIGGFYIVGSTSRTVLVQGLGPALGPLGVSGFLAHPELSIHQSQNGGDVTLYSNTGWGSSPVLLAAAASVFATPALATGSADSELLLTLPPGGYSAEVGGADGGTGVALCAIYELP